MILMSMGVLAWQRTYQVSVDVQTTDSVPTLSIVATIYPLQDFAQAIGGEQAWVRGIVPLGMEPHEYEPSPQDIVRMYQADIVLFNGAGIDAWAEKIRPALETRGVTVLRMSDIGDVSDMDPHFWLDPVWTIEAVEAIQHVLIVRDPSHTKVYTDNADRYKNLLVQIDTEYRQGLRQCASHTVATSHNALWYLAERYGFSVLPISPIVPDTEASPRALVESIEEIRTLGLQYVMYETLDGPRVADSIAQETGVMTLSFNALEGLTVAEVSAGKNYISVMRDNLHNLQTVLQCQ